MMRDERWRGISLYRARIPGDASGASLPMIAVCTVPDREISDRSAHGEADIDVADEHTSWFWFTDRAGFRRASQIARLLASGRRFPKGSGDYIEVLRPVHAAFVSPHHVQQKEVA